MSWSVPPEPFVEPMSGIAWQGALKRDAQRFGEKSAGEERAKNGVGQARRAAAQFAEEIDGTEQSLARSKAIALNARMKQLSFQQREVDVRRAFGRARFAGETVAEGRFHFDGTQRITIGHATHFKRGANGVRSPAGGHYFFA